MSYLLMPFAENMFMIKALIAGILVSIACGIVGTFVIIRGLAFIGDALAHGVLPGVVIAKLLCLPTIFGAAFGALGMILGVSVITRRSRLPSDTAIGLLLVSMLALGVAIVSGSRTLSGDLIRILFGELLGVENYVLIIQLFATVATICLAKFCYRPFLLLCFSPEQAEISGFSYYRYHAIMLIMIALTVVISFQTVGTLLVFGMLLAPAASASLFSRRITTMMIYASVIGTISVYLGLLISYHFSIAAGAAITLVASTIFFSLFCVKEVLYKKNIIKNSVQGLV